MADCLRAPIATLFPDDTRIVAKLQRLGIETIEDLLATDDVTLMASPNIGVGTLPAVHDALVRAGLDRRQTESLRRPDALGAILGHLGRTATRWRVNCLYAIMVRPD